MYNQQKIVSTNCLPLFFESRGNVFFFFVFVFPWKNTVGAALVLFSKDDERNSTVYFTELSEIIYL